MNLIRRVLRAVFPFVRRSAFEGLEKSFLQQREQMRTVERRGEERLQAELKKERASLDAYHEQVRMNMREIRDARCYRVCVDIEETLLYRIEDASPVARWLASKVENEILRSRFITTRG